MRCRNVVVLSVLAGACSAASAASVFSGFEADAVGSYPAGWSLFHAGGSQSVVASPVFAGSRAFQQVGQPFSAAESHLAVGLPAGDLTLSFAFQLSGQSTSTTDGDALVQLRANGLELGAAISRGPTGHGPYQLQLQGFGLVGLATLDHWYFVEAEYSRATHAATYRVDGVTLASNVPIGDLGLSGYIMVHTGAINHGVIVGYYDNIALVPAPGLAAAVPACCAVLLGRPRRR